MHLLHGVVWLTSDIAVRERQHAGRKKSDTSSMLAGEKWLCGRSADWSMGQFVSCSSTSRQ